MLGPEGHRGNEVTPEQQNALWELVRSNSDEAGASLWEALEERGWLPLDPYEVPDEDLPVALERLILDLSWIQVYVNFTDHLDDRQLYTRLVAVAGSYDHWIYPNDAESAVSVSLLPDDPDEGSQIWLRYYASEEERTRHLRHHPGVSLPPSELPPYPRVWIPERPLFD
jgi:hypothetical protein